MWATWFLFLLSSQFLILSGTSDWTSLLIWICILWWHHFNKMRNGLYSCHMITFTDISFQMSLASPRLWPILCSVSINWAIFRMKKKSESHVYWLHVTALNCCKYNKHCVADDTGCQATIGGKSHLPATPTGGEVDTCNCILTLTQPQREK